MTDDKKDTTNGNGHGHGEEEVEEQPPKVEPDTDIDDNFSFGGDDDSSLGDISQEEVYRRRSTAVSQVLPDGGVRDPIFPAWSHFTEAFHNTMTMVVVACAVTSAKNPIPVIIGVSVLALTLIAVGFFTNFYLELDFEVVFTPLGSAPEAHYNWINSPEGFPNRVRNIALLFHRNGDNVLTVEAMERVFKGVNIVRDTPGYGWLCSQGSYVDFSGDKTCRIMSATGYWTNHSLETFKAETTTDLEVKERVSNFTFANGAPVYQDAILGNWAKEGKAGTPEEGLITTAQSYLVSIDVPDLPEADDFEVDMLNALDKQRREWMKEDSASGETVLVMDVMTIYAYEIEFLRAIKGDLYLIPVVAFIMCGFVALTMAKFGNSGHDKLKSRGVLGFMAVYTIGMSYIAGNGLMFLCGVPFTTITQILPFVVVGIGLDDTFIITGEYFRTDPRIDTVERIRMTMNEVSHSICLTTITTTFAFLLGLMSSLPGVRWLCLYAFTTIAIDFVFQITLFMAFIVMDESRIQAHRRDCCLCCFKTDDHPDVKAKKKAAAAAAAGSGGGDSSNNGDTPPAPRKSNGATAGGGGGDDHPHKGRRGTVKFQDMTIMTESNAKERRQSEMPGKAEGRPSTMSRRRTSIARRVSVFDAKSIPQRIMVAYSEFLLQPVVKGLVLLVFGAFFGVCLWSCTQLTQAFNLGDYVPADSYLKDVLFTFENYASVIRPMAVYFRHIDQADPDIQQQMIDYIEDLEALPQISSSIDIDLNGTEFEGQDELKPFCWVRDFRTYEKRINEEFPVFESLDFNTKVKFALDTQPVLRELYGQDIIIDEESGNITGSRCMLFISELDLTSIDAQVEMLHDQRAVGSVQPLNAPLAEADWKMFFFDQLLFYWEAYDVAIQELIFTIASGVVTLAVIAVILIPHWTAIFIVTPMISMIYINYLGTLQMFGMHVNGVFYICIVVAIGLLVDFLMHILLRYYETSPTMTRDERVKETLETMGASILLGGLTTFLGVVPLCLSTTKIFMTVFLAFFGMVLLGITHGLIFLPVVLSLIGPTTGIAVYEDGVTTFESSFKAEDKDKLMAELLAIEAEANRREAEAEGAEGGDVSEALGVKDEKGQPEQPEEQAAPSVEMRDVRTPQEKKRRSTLTQVYV